MKAIKPEDRPKAIGLTAGVVIVFALVTMRVKSALGGDFVPPPDNAKVSISGTSGSTSGSPGTTPIQANSTPTPGLPKLKTNSDTVKLLPAATPPRKDPFQPHQGIGDRSDELAVKIAREHKQQVTGEGTAFSNPEPDSVPADTSLPKIAPTKGATSLTPINPNSPEVDSEGQKNDYPQLNGIISGPKAVAIIKVGGKDYIVMIGDAFGNGFRLLSATDLMVVISQRMTHFTLKVGSPMD